MNIPKIVATVYDKRGRKISTGSNYPIRTHPKQFYLSTSCGEPYKIFIHAEVAALLKCRGAKPHKIVVERYDSTGQPALAKPCPICQQMIESYGIKIIEYTH